MSRVLVTGGTGFIGQPVCRELIQGGFDVAILTRSYQINRDNKYKFIRSDLNLNPSAIADIVAFNPTEIIHLAWDGIPDFSARKCNENLQKSKFFFQIVLEHCHIEKVVVTGSCLEVSAAKGEVDRHKWQVDQEFTQAKKSLFDWLNSISSEKKFALFWPRLFYVYGQGQRSGSLIPTVCDSLIREGELPQLRSVDDCLDYIHVDDVAKAIRCCLISKSRGGVFNIASGQATCVKEILRYLLNLRFKKNNVAFTPISKCLDSADRCFWGNIEDSDKFLNWKPSKTLEIGLYELYQSYKNSGI